MILNIALNILPPDDRIVFLRFELLRDVVRPPFNCVEPVLAEHTGHMSLDGNNGGGSDIVPEARKRCDGLMNNNQGLKASQLMSRLPG